MATYRQIHIHIWDDPKFEGLSPHAKLLFIYGFSNKHRNEAGIYTITVRKMAFETGLTIEQAEAAIKEIEAAGMWRYDWENQVLWVKNALRYQSVSEKCLVAIRRDLENIRSPLVEEFKEYYKALLYPSDRVSIGYRNGSDRVSIGYPNGTEALSGNGNGKGKGKNKNTTPTESKDSVGQKPKKKTNVSIYDEDDKRLVEIMKSYREENGIPPTERDWHLRQLAIVHKLRKTYSTNELLECFEEIKRDKYWCTQLDSWATVERYLPKWKLRQRARAEPPRRPLDDDINWIPFEPS